MVEGDCDEVSHSGVFTPVVLGRLLLNGFLQHLLVPVLEVSLQIFYTNQIVEKMLFVKK